MCFASGSMAWASFVISSKVPSVNASSSALNGSLKERAPVMRPRWAFSFAKYQVNVKDPQRVTLSEGIQLAVNMIAAHIGPEAQKLNPERWAATGGITRVATITYSHGFQWADYASSSELSQT